MSKTMQIDKECIVKHFDEDYITPQTLSDLTGLTSHYINSMCRDGKLSAIRKSASEQGRWLISLKAVFDGFGIYISGKEEQGDEPIDVEDL